MHVKQHDVGTTEEISEIAGTTSSASPGIAHPQVTIAWHVLLQVFFAPFFFVPWFAITVLIVAIVFASRARRRGRRDR